MKTSTIFVTIILIIPQSCLIQLAKGQIVYTDIIDTTAVNNYYIDINNDGIDDFHFGVDNTLKGCGVDMTFSGHADVYVTPENGNEVVGPGSANPFMFSYEEVIGSNSGYWNNSSDQILSKVTRPHCGDQYKWTGQWSNSDAYLGARLKLDGKYHYGWIEVTPSVGLFPGATYFTVHDYAFNSIPDSSILAGQTCPPQASIIANGPTTFCEGDSVIFSSANTGTNLSYKWKLNGVNISGATNKDYTAKIAGKYKVNVKDNTNGCSATSVLVKVKVPCKVIDQNLNSDCHFAAVYPNPLSSATTISFSLPQSENISLKIYDLRGRLIRTLANENMNEGTHTLIWNACDENGNAVSAGIYLLRIESADHSETMLLSLIK